MALSTWFVPTSGSRAPRPVTTATRNGAVGAQAEADRLRRAKIAAIDTYLRLERADIARTFARIKSEIQARRADLPTGGASPNTVSMQSLYDAVGRPSRVIPGKTFEAKRPDGTTHIRQISPSGKYLYQPGDIGPFTGEVISRVDGKGGLIYDRPSMRRATIPMRGVERRAW